jgi:hypothetical protein
MFAIKRVEVIVFFIGILPWGCAERKKQFTTIALPTVVFLFPGMLAVCPIAHHDDVAHTVLMMAWYIVPSRLSMLGPPNGSQPSASHFDRTVSRLWIGALTIR